MNNPELVVVGDEIVVDETKTVEVMEYQNPDAKVSDKKQVIKLPAIGTKFMVAGQEYKVVYLNEGKNRFSAEPCSGMY